MENIITYDNLRNFAYSNDKLIKGEIKGIILNFPGLGATNMHAEDIGEAREYAQAGLIYVIPYYNPWCWMNDQTIAFVDEIVSVLAEHYGLGDSVRVASTGRSMGGLCALVYTAYARITPVACITNCPVCDLPFHMTERPDLPRTLYSAFGASAGTMDEALRAHSPLHLVDRMPLIPYTVFHCCEDKAVNIYAHSEKYVKAMVSGHDINYIRVPHRAHCDLSPSAKVKYQEAILKAFE